MPNRFFTNLIDLVAGTRARAGDVEANFNQVEQGFDEVASEIDALVAGKADIAGEAYTGTHDFSAATAVALPAATNIGLVSSDEIFTLNGVTGNLQAQIDAKVNRAGDTYAGQHNFEGATTRVATQPFGTAGTLAASVEFVNNAMFQTILPGQLGQEPGSVLTTDGVDTATWQAPTSPLGRLYFFGGM